MSRTRIGGTCLIALLAASAVAAGNASATLPELGRCVKVEGVVEGKKTVHHGTYTSPKCTTESPSKTGKYEWLPGPGPLPKWSGFSEGVTLETVGHAQVTCTESVITGEYTGAKTETVQLELFECESLHKPCQTAGQGAGEIDAESLEGEIGFISNGPKPSVGLDLKHSPNVVSFDCGKTPEVAAVGVVEGSVIAAIKRLDTMTMSFVLNFKANEGKQIPESFEGGAKDTLTTTLVVGLSRTVEESGLTAKVEIENAKLSSKGAKEGPGEPTEIKAVV